MDVSVPYVTVWLTNHLSLSSLYVQEPRSSVPSPFIVLCSALQTSNADEPWPDVQTCRRQYTLSASTCRGQRTGFSNCKAGGSVEIELRMSEKRGLLDESNFPCDSEPRSQSSGRTNVSQEQIKQVSKSKSCHPLAAANTLVRRVSWADTFAL